MKIIYVTVAAVDDYAVLCPLHSAVVLFVVCYLKQKENTDDLIIYLVCDDNIGDEYLVNVCCADLEFLVIDKLDLLKPISLCILPVFFFENENFCVAGICSVLRQVVMSYKENWKSLLGFRERCLAACAETSKLTKFCEIDLINEINKILKHKTGNKFLSLEKILNQLPKIHNKEKEIRINKNFEMKRIFIEGPEIHLVDLIIFPMVHILFIHEGQKMFSYIPKTVAWYSTMLSVTYVKNIISKMFDENFKINKFKFDISDGIKNIKIETDSKSKFETKFIEEIFHKSKFTKQQDIEIAVEKFKKISNDLITEINTFDIGLIMLMETNEINWDDLPFSVHPKGGKLPPDRIRRKIQQLESVYQIVNKFIKNGDTVIDFCCGGGHIGIIVAYFRKDCNVILLDNNERALQNAATRIQKLNLKNICIIQSNVDYFKGTYDIGVALHPCGVATDLIIDNCIKQNASFVVAPCCYGKIKENHILEYPRSNILRNSELSCDDYFVLAHSADQTHKYWYDKTDQGETCMDIIDIDRCLYAQENNYKIGKTKMVPPNCTPKHNIIFGESYLKILS